MGQYYMPIIGDAYGLNCKVFDRSVNHEYTFAKLMEHSWWENTFVNAFSEFLYNKPRRVAWVGDYADEPDDFDFPHCSAFYVPCYKEVWGETVATHTVYPSDFTLDGKFLLNHDTRQFVNLNEYKQLSTDKDSWCIHPLPLLTAAGISTRATPALKTSGSGRGNLFPLLTSRRKISRSSRSCSRRTPDDLRRR